MRVVVLVVAALCVLPGGFEEGRNGRVAIAQPATPGQPSASAMAAAKIHFAAAEKLFQAQAYADAEAEYKAAYAAAPLDGFFFNIAQCERNQGHTAEAIDYFERFLKSPKAEAQRGVVEGILLELRRKQAAEAEAAIAAAPTPEPPAHAEVPPPEMPPVAAAAESAEVAGAVAETPRAAVTPDTSDKKEKTPVYKKAWFWVVTGAAVVVVAGAIALGVTASSAKPSGSLGTADWR